SPPSMLKLHDFCNRARQLAAGKVPLVFNCSAGKDRTGVAAAIILSALGVPMEEVIADYMLTNDSIGELAGILEQEPEYSRWVAEQPEVAYPLLRAEPEYLQRTFSILETRHGGIEGYLTGRLGISSAEIATIRALLLD
ncbi:tyrosine-protein phosphatase, partial [Sphingobium sp. DC-2]|uniref:tyrosine-protein phosphatase n=1 Tax=Sphingobium sp. DC-2 TaxID=1303256 RepID=UPI0004C2BBE1